ncbi:MAG: CotH kinase family protein [Bacteroidota bacterium]
MSKKHLLYAFLFVVLIAGCKKNEIGGPSTNGASAAGKGKTSPIMVTSAPQLLDLKINGVSAAYDSSSVSYYYPVPVGASLANYIVSFDTTAATYILINDVKVKNNSTVSSALTTNQTLVVKAVNSLNQIASYDFVVTGLPIVQLKAGAKIGDTRIAGVFDLVNPDYQAQGSKAEISSNIMISIRGGTSRYFPKSSYSVHMVDSSGNDTNVSLMGLRNDNNWILDAMYIDQARMRNRLCTDIWNSYNNVPHIASEPTALNGTRGYMAEVFLNKHYAGVYCLTEKLDRKQLQVKKQYGDMYKADFWTDQTDFNGTIPFDNTSATWGGWELEYPGIGDTPAPDWSYLSNIVNYIATSTDADFAANIKSKVDINNMVDYFIFINMLDAADNENKNTFFSFYDYRTAPSFFYSPWDLDGTMGRNAGGSYKDHEIIGANNNNLLQRLLNLNVGGFKDLLKARWNSLRNNQFSKTTVGNRIEGYRKVLVNTNAITRERVVWTNITQDLNTETAYMTTWYGAQYDLFDTYINNLQ